MTLIVDVDRDLLKELHAHGSVRNLREVRLLEYSPVIWGMNPATGTLDVKGDGDAKAGRRMRRDKAELVGKIREMLTDLAAWIDYADEQPEEKPEDEKENTAPADAGRVAEGTPEKAGPGAAPATPPTWERDRLALLFDIEALQN
jgi:hypothetical protein